MSNDNHNDLTRIVEPELLTAYALGQLQGEELAQVEALLAAGNGDADHEIAAMRALAGVVSDARAVESIPELATGLRQRIQEQLARGSVQIPKSKVQSWEGGTTAEPVTISPSKKPWWRRPAFELCLIGGICCALLALFMLPAVQMSREAARRMQSSNNLRQLALAKTSDESPYDYAVVEEGRVNAHSQAVHGLGDDLNWEQAFRNSAISPNSPQSGERENQSRMMSRNDNLPPGDRLAAVEFEAAKAQARNESEIEVAESAIEVSKADLDANDQIRRSRGVSESEARKYKFQYDRSLAQMKQAIKEKEVQDLTEFRTQDGESARQWQALSRSRRESPEGPGTEQYAPIIENRFLSPLEQPLSTFSIDVDTASYANVRWFLNEGRLPPANSVRIEELVNYFRYDYPQPAESRPFSVNMEVTQCPWREGHLLLRVGLKGKEVHRSERPASNLVFLLDVSGSMADQNKLPLLKTAMKLLVGELGENDKVSIVTYAGEAGLRLKPTRGHEQAKINRVIDGLSAGGSTNGSAGIELAYEQAVAGFIQGGANRVILCTDGDLNVGITSDEALVKLIKKKAAGGTFLTVLGFGEGNLKDAKMEKLADNGNGLYAYIDSVREAKKVLVEQLTGSTITIAKDVKIQIEFNPREIGAYRLLGYENRVMAAQDFNNDKKDAGDIGAGHTVTALYELVPAETSDKYTPQPRDVDPLKYQGTGDREQETADSKPLTTHHSPLTTAASSGELLTLKLRYKDPDGQTSKLIEYPLKDRGHSFHSASSDLQFAAAVASFGMILRGSQHRGSSNLAAVAEIASGAIGKDEGGYRAEFVDLVRKAQQLGAR